MKTRNIILIIVAVAALLCAVGGMVVVGKLSKIKSVELDETRVITADQNNKTAAPNASLNVASSTEQPQVTAAAEEVNPYSGYQIIALVGLDSREGEDYANSDTMILACLNHDSKEIRLVSIYRDTYLNIGNGVYTKANAAYCLGGPEQFLTMVNLNLDLNVTQFATTRFKALADTIDALGGLDIELTREELIHMNNYNVETSEVCGYEYSAVEIPDDPYFDGVNTRVFHLTGTQAVSYARIRYTAGYDYKRTERQRIVIAKIFEKLKSADLATVNSIVDTVFPQIKTNLSMLEILSLAKSVLTYQIVDQTGFPFTHVGSNIGIGDMVVPTTLESNVISLHEFIFPGVSYSPSYTVSEYSNVIASDLSSGRSTGSDDEDEETTVTPTPTVTVTPEATATPTAEPTSEATATPTPEVTVTEEPTAEPTQEPEEPVVTEEPSQEAPSDDSGGDSGDSEQGGDE